MARAQTRKIVFKNHRQLVGRNSRYQYYNYPDERSTPVTFDEQNSKNNIKQNPRQFITQNRTNKVENTISQRVVDKMQNAYIYILHPSNHASFFRTQIWRTLLEIEKSFSA